MTKNVFIVSEVKTSYDAHTIVWQDVKEWKYLKSKPIAFRYKDRRKHMDEVSEYYDKNPDRTQRFVYDATHRSKHLVPVNAWYDCTWQLVVWDDKPSK